MQNETVARRYALAIFALAKERGAVDATGRDLHVALDALQASDDVRRFFTSPVIDRADKERVVSAALESAVGELALHSVLLLIRKRREALLGPIVAQYDALALEDAGRQRLEVTTARALGAGELADLVARLARVYGKTFEVEATVDPDLLGGVRITLGDLRIDNSLAGRLDELARDLNPHAITP